MNSNILRFAMVIGWLLLGLYVMLQIITGGFNSVGQLFFYLTTGLAILGFLQPRLGFWVLAISFGYLDMLKRFLILEDYVSYYDIALVLALAPILSVSIYCSLAVRALLSRDNTRKGVIPLILAAAAISAFLGAVGYLNTGGLGGVKNAANYGAYATLIYTVPALFPNRVQIWKMLKVIVLLFVPTAIYAYWQLTQGLSWWEIEYLETGLTGESRILEGQDYRIFSTLNSSQNLCKVMALAGALALVIPWRKDQRKTVLNRVFSIGLFALFMGAAYASGSRTGLVMGLVLLAAYAVFRYKVVTIASYALFGITLLAVIVFAEHLVENRVLDDWQTSLRSLVGAETEETVARTRLTTLTVRLESLATLKDPRVWTPFGEKFSGVNLENLPGHDVITNLLRTVGFIPLGFAGITGMILLWKFHHLVWRERENRDLRLLGFGLVACVLVGGISAHSNLYTFPINAFLYLGMGIVGATVVRRRAPAPAPGAAPAPVRPRMGMPPMGGRGIGSIPSRAPAQGVALSGEAPSSRQG